MYRPQKSPLETLQKVRDQLQARGSTTIRSLGRVFRQLDSLDGNRKLDQGEFFTGMKELGVQLSREESDSLMSMLDKNHDGVVDYDEFLVAIRGRMNPRRQALVDKAFLKFDKDGNGSIQSADLKGVYNTRMHPKVKSGEMTEAQVFSEFLSSFGDVNKDGSISRQVNFLKDLKEFKGLRGEWNDYYSAVSASIDNDDHFVQLIKMAWKLD